MKRLDSWYYGFSIQFSQPLTDAQKLFVEQCIGYSASKNVRGEQPIFTWSSGGYLYALEVYLDTTKSRRDDIGDAFADFWDDVEIYLVEGSPIRKKCGTRLFENTLKYNVLDCLHSIVSDDDAQENPAETTKTQVNEIDVGAVREVYLIAKERAKTTLQNKYQWVLDNVLEAASQHESSHTLHEVTNPLELKDFLQGKGFTVEIHKNSVTVQGWV